MKNIVITIFILSVTLNSAIFEHSTDVKEMYLFDSDKQMQNEKLAAELDKFKNNTVTKEEIDTYIKLRDEDNQTKAFDRDIYVDAGILKQRNIVSPEVEMKNKSCNWITSILAKIGLYSCVDESKNIDSNTTDTNTSEGEVK